MEASAYFHEDDYCQMEILPSENLTYCKKQMDDIDEFSEVHKDEDSFTDIFIREESPISLADRKIPVARLEQALGPILEKYDRVFTGYSSYRVECKNTGAFVYNENISVFYDVDGGVINHLWLMLVPYTQEELEKGIAALNALASLGDLILADWGWSFVENLQNSAQIASYMNERLKVFSEL